MENKDINIMSEEKAAQLKELLAASQHIVLTAHKSPDGDALGSILGMASWLRQIGKQDVTPVVPDAYPDFLKWMPDCEKIMRYDKHPDEVKQHISDADLIICLDFNTISRVEDMAPVLAAAKAPKVLIDHHLDPDSGFALTFSHPEASSTCELVFRVIRQLGGLDEITKLCAIQLYTGMMTDTGGFTYNSTDPIIYAIIAELLTKHIDKDKIYRNVFNTLPAWAIRFRGYLMNQKLNYFSDLNASYYTVTKDDMQRYHFIKGDLEGLVNEPLRIKGTKLSVSLREDTDKPGRIYVSLRSVDDFPCNKMAADFFNGGGHLNASGGKLFCTMEEAEKTVRKAFSAYAEMLK